MDMTGERLIVAPRETVWTALNDPQILKACIPGCESIEKLSDTEMKALVAVKLGPISAKFNGKVDLTEIDAPNSYTLVGEGQGGVAGFGKGSAKVRLEAEAGATRLFYVVNSQVGGKMAQLGARLIDSTAKSYAETFFSRFSELVAPTPIPTPAEVASAEAAPVHFESTVVNQTEPDRHVVPHSEPEYDHSNPVVAGLPLGIWIPLLIAVVMVILVLMKFL